MAEVFVAGFSSGQIGIAFPNILFRRGTEQRQPSVMISPAEDQLERARLHLSAAMIQEGTP
jgi:hypothetical protein